MINYYFYFTSFSEYFENENFPLFLNYFLFFTVNKSIKIIAIKIIR